MYDAAVATPAARLAVLLGSPGLGKSRLIDELARRLGDATIRARRTATPPAARRSRRSREALRALLGLDDGGRRRRGARGDRGGARRAATTRERARIAAGIAALLAGSPAVARGDVLRRAPLPRRRSPRREPVVLVIDDLHWAEPLLLDLVEHLVQWGSGVPLFVLVGARPELRELRSSLVDARRRSSPTW